MRINQTIEEYDVKSLKTILSTVDHVVRRCNDLEMMARGMEHNLSMAERDFTSENFTRGKEIIQGYIRRLEEARAEFTELLNSVIEFAEKLDYNWRAW